MRHKVYGKHLGRDKNERTALFKNLVQSLFLHGSIQTTQAKAKAIKGLVDKIINKSKPKDPRFRSRTSGYTSIVNLGPRKGDGAMMVKMTLL
ncbi:hypothetical protein HYU96_03380 [Candidatus Daviesbacteria bacterium]|nr:hypothetical protein [Candidatus Daviesbacteria bacterium]